MLIVGVDVGKKGAAVALESSGKYHSHLIGTEPYDFMCFLQSLPSQSLIYIEHAQAMPKNGTVSMFNYGMGFGQLQGICLALGFAFKLVKPQIWQRQIHAGISHIKNPKERSLIKANAIYPKIDFRASKRCKKPHDGFVDALLIARYGISQVSL